MEFPNTKILGSEYIVNTKTASVVTKYGGLYGCWKSSWKKYLVRELSKTPNGMDGLCKTENGYTNRLNNEVSK